MRLTQLRWTAGVMAPRVFRLRPVEPEKPKENRVLLLRLRVETDPASGERKVVANCPDPYTGQAEREDAPGGRQPPGTVAMPGGSVA